MEIVASDTAGRLAVPPKRVLVVRLSSLGDLILSTAALGELQQKFGSGLAVDWIVSKEFAPLLVGLPHVARVIPFDRRAGFWSWMRVIREVRSRSADYELALDLHRSLRSSLLRWLTVTQLRWRVLQKERWRLEGFFLFRRAWPKIWRPRPMVHRFGEAVSGMTAARPDLSAFLAEKLPSELAWPAFSSSVAVAPGSLWPGKQWPLESFIRVVQELVARKIQVVILGSSSDLAAQALVKAFSASLPSAVVVDRVGKLDLRQLGSAIARCDVLLGNDSGLAHYAEAVGVPCVTLFGPTSPAQGFGAWRAESRSIEPELWCRPCSRGGERCFRRGDSRYCCIRMIPVDRVVAALLSYFPQESGV